MKKAITILLACLLLALSVAGCGKTDTNTATQPGGNITENGETNEPSDETTVPAGADVLVVRSRSTGNKTKEGNFITLSQQHLEKWTVYDLSGDNITSYQEYYLYGTEAIAAECAPYYSYDNGKATGKIISTDKQQTTSTSRYETREELLQDLEGSKTAELVDTQDIQILFDNADAYVAEHLSPVTVKVERNSQYDQEHGITESYQVVYFDEYGVYSSHDDYTVFTDAAAAQAYQAEHTVMSVEGNVVYLLGSTDDNTYGKFGYTKFGSYGVYGFAERWYGENQKVEYEVFEGVVTPLN